MMHEQQRRVWCPDDIIKGKYGSHACLILNRKIRIPVSIAEHLWESAYIRCTVDGGTNRWRDFLEAHCQGRNMKPPDYITGDFDSITKETLQYFQHPNTKRVHTPDQNETDFTKAVRIVLPLLQEKRLKDIVVFHDTSGRIDHIMANINTLHKMLCHDVNIYLLSGACISWLLSPGQHFIKIPKNLVTEQRWCALMPVGQPAPKVTTSGLKWNLAESMMQFGALVSTSNTYACERVHVETTTPLLWSMGVFVCDED